MTADDVAVIIVNYNAGEYLITCLEALHVLPETPGEIMVVDNASDDGSYEAAKARFPGVDFIEAGSNTGFAAANNLGINSTDKPWVALVNPDAFVAENWLQVLLEAVRENPQVSVYSCELVDARNPTLLDGQGDCYHVSGLMWRRKNGQAVDSPPSQLPFFAPCAASAMYLRSAVLAVGAFDEDYFCYIEDVDLGFRLRLAGYQCLHLHDAITYHIGSAITERDSDFSIYYGHRNLVWTYFKNMPAGPRWRYMWQHLLMNMVSIAFYTAKGRPGVIFRAKWDAIKGLPAQIRKRKAQQKRIDPDQAKINITSVMARGWLTPYLHRHD
jgi:GT2 family glycosyltransferase